MRKFFTLVSFLMFIGQMSYSQCATLSPGTVSASGPFTCGDAFTLCVTVTTYTQTDYNYLFAADLAGLPSGSTVSPGSPAPNDLGQGDWVWNSTYQGWEFDDSAFADLGFGVDCTTCDITFCYNVTLPAAPCTSSTFNPTVSVFGDFTSACNDPAVTPSGWANQVLPIELKTIRAFNKGNQNLITWTNASESNNDIQMVERSIDGKSGWEMIDKVAGTNNSEEVTYEVVDQNPMNTSFYRIHAIDFDGRAQFSKIVVVRREGGSGIINSTQPNPTINFIEVELQPENSGDINYSVMDVTGKLVKSIALYAKDGELNTHKIDMSDLQNGLYLISIRGGGLIQNTKIIKE